VKFFSWILLLIWKTHYPEVFMIISFLFFQCYVSLGIGQVPLHYSDNMYMKSVFHLCLHICFITFQGHISFFLEVPYITTNLLSSGSIMKKYLKDLFVILNYLIISKYSTTHTLWDCVIRISSEFYYLLIQE
jgi:hypothetical protein